MSTINIETTCSFTGHRAFPQDFDTQKLISVIEKLIDNGYNTFLVGMALGFDTVCFTVLENLRKTYDIRLIACVPCKTQDKGFSKEERKKYKQMLESANEIIYLSEEYYVGCMHKRNRFMVDNSSVVVAYLTHTRGGTYSTVRYAVNSGKEVIYLEK